MDIFLVIGLWPHFESLFVVRILPVTIGRGKNVLNIPQGPNSIHSSARHGACLREVQWNLTVGRSILLWNKKLYCVSFIHCNVLLFHNELAERCGIRLLLLLADSCVLRRSFLCWMLLTKSNVVILKLNFLNHHQKVGRARSDSWLT